MCLQLLLGDQSNYQLILNGKGSRKIYKLIKQIILIKQFEMHIEILSIVKSNSDDDQP